MPVAAIDLPAAQRLVPDDVPSAIVHYTLTDERGLALLLTRDSIEVVPLPNLTHAEASALVQKWYDAYYADRDNFDEAIPALLEPVSERAVWPVMEHLAGRGIQRLILRPTSPCTCFRCTPAAWPTALTSPTPVKSSTRPACPFSTAAPPRGRSRRDLLLVENPTADLPFTEIEGQRAAPPLPRPRPPLRWRGNEGPAPERRRSLPRPQLHRPRHLQPDGAAASALVLGNKDDESQWLTLRDVFCTLHLPDNWLTVINGCESGMLRPDQLDELVMLPTGFLYAGATCVLCTLWRVYDLSSASAGGPLPSRVAGRPSRRPGQRPHIGTALREAQRWLRRTSPAASSFSANCCRSCSRACATSCCAGSARSRRRITRRSVPTARRSSRRRTGPLSRRLVWPIRYTRPSAPPPCPSDAVGDPQEGDRPLRPRQRPG